MCFFSKIIWLIKLSSYLCTRFSRNLLKAALNKRRGDLIKLDRYRFHPKVLRELSFLHSLYSDFQFVTGKF